MITHISAASRLVNFKGQEHLCAFVAEFCRLQGIAEIWFDHDTNIGHTLTLSGETTSVYVLPFEGLFERVITDWKRPGGSYRIPWRGASRFYRISTGGEFDFCDGEGCEFDIPTGAIARFLFPGHSHYLVFPDGSMMDMELL